MKFVLEQLLSMGTKNWFVSSVMDEESIFQEKGNNFTSASYI